MIFGSPLEWRETHRQPRFLIFDGRIVVLVVLTIMHFRIWTLATLLVAAVTLVWFDRKGVPAESILRWMRASIVGRNRSARGSSAQRPPVDFGFETYSDVRRAIAKTEALNLRKASGKNESGGRKAPQGGKASR